MHDNVTDKWNVLKNVDITIKTSEQKYTSTFEDVLSDKADMDMNDFVCQWQYGNLKDLYNNVKKVGIKLNVTAVGAKNQIAAAIKIRHQ